MSQKDTNYTKEAFLHPWNLAFLIAAMFVTVMTSFVAGAASWPIDTLLLFGMAIELLYLGIMPRQERFRRAIRSKEAAEHAKPPSQKEIFQHLTKHSQRRYAKLRKLGKDMQGNYRKMSYASQGMLDSHVSKINGLLDSYLTLLYQRERYEQTSHTSAEAEVVRAISALREDMVDDPPKVRSIKQRRHKILEQRLDRLKKGVENLEIIDAQLETIEDVVKYIHEQSMTLSNPEEITFQLDTLLSEVEETQIAVEEIEDVFGRSKDLLEDLDSYESEEDKASRRTRERE